MYLVMNVDCGNEFAEVPDLFVFEFDKKVLEKLRHFYTIAYWVDRAERECFQSIDFAVETKWMNVKQGVVILGLLKEVLDGDQDHAFLSDLPAGLEEAEGSELGHVTIMRHGHDVRRLREVERRRVLHYNDEARRFHEGGEEPQEDRQTMTSFKISSGVGHKTEEPFVMIESDKIDSPIQMSAEDAIDLAQLLLEAAEGALSDAYLVDFLRHDLHQEDEGIIVQMLKMFRAYRAKRHQEKKHEGNRHDHVGSDDPGVSGGEEDADSPDEGPDEDQ